MFSTWELPAKVFAFYIVIILLVAVFVYISANGLSLGNWSRINPSVYATVLNQQMVQADLEANRLGIAVGEPNTNTGAVESIADVNKPVPAFVAGALGCLMSSQHSVISPALNMNVINDTGSPKELVWVGYDGTRQSYGIIQPGDSVTRPTQKAHVWQMQNGQKKCLSEFRPSPVIYLSKV